MADTPFTGAGTDPSLKSRPVKTSIPPPLSTEKVCSITQNQLPGVTANNGSTIRFWERT
jgi:hypothetical protein